MSNPAPGPVHRPPRYRLYVDESGDHAYRKLEIPSHRYLALLGAWFGKPERYTAFADGLERLKRDVLAAHPDDPVVLHRSDIINRKGPFGRLVDPAVRARFDASLLDLVARASFTLVCVVIDKQRHLDRHSSPFHPYHYCATALLERNGAWLDFYHAVGDVMAESRGREEDLQLREAYRRVYEAGTQFQSHEQFQRTLTSKDIKLKARRQNIAGLQLADVLAHPVKQHCLAERGLIDAVPDGFGKELVAVANEKFHAQRPQGSVEGYGRVYL